MVDDSARSADLRRWQQAADRHVTSTPSGEVASGRAPVQRMRMSQSNSFYGDPRDSSEFPLFYRASILQHLARQGITVAEDTPQVLCVPIVYGQTVEIRWFEVTAEDVRDMQRAVNALTPEAREAARLDANARGDDTGDVNPSAFQDNCGYCVLTRLLGKDDADQLVKEMEEADLADGMANHWLSLDSIADTLQRYGRSVGFPATNLNRDRLREWILGISQGSDQVAFVVHFPSHFIIAYPQSDGSILIEDPQSTDFFDFDALPDTVFKTFAVDRP